MASNRGTVTKLTTKTKSTLMTQHTNNRSNPYTRTRRNYDEETRSILFAKDREIERLHRIIQQAEEANLSSVGFIGGLIVGILFTAVATLIF